MATEGRKTLTGTGHGIKKGPVYRDSAVPWLRSLSKAALLDCVVDLLKGQADSAEDEVTAEQAVERLTPVLILRGDRVPKP